MAALHHGFDLHDCRSVRTAAILPIGTFPLTNRALQHAFLWATPRRNALVPQWSSRPTLLCDGGAHTPADAEGLVADFYQILMCRT